MERQPTIYDVAREADVSRQTVSNVVNSPDRVRPETRDRVLAAISRLGYQPHASARRLRLQRSGTIGVRIDQWINGISGSVLDRFLHNLTEQADARGIRVLLYTAHSPEHELQQLMRLFDGALVDGIVITGTSHGDPRIKWMLREGHPFVSFGRPWGEDPATRSQHRWVDVDGSEGIYQATHHLVAQGARRVGFIGWPSPSGTGDDRRSGWVRGLQDAGLTPAYEAAGVDDPETGARGARELAGRHDVDAIVCASDSLALGASGVVGDRLPVVGFDNTPVSSALGFSSVDQPLDLVAAAVLDSMERAVAGQAIGDDEHGVLVMPRLVLRGA